MKKKERDKHKKDSHSLLWGLFFIVLCLPTYVIRFSFYSIPTTFFEIVLLLFFLYASALLIQKKNRSLVQSALQQYPLFYCWGALFIIIGGIAVFFAPNFLAALGIYKAYIVEPVLFAAISLVIIRSQKDVVFLCTALSLSAFFIAVTAIIQYVTGIGIPEPWNLFPDRRATSIYGYPNAVGLFLTPILCILTSIVLFEKNLSQKTTQWYLVVVLLSFFALFASRSDAGIVTSIATIIILLFFTRFRYAAILIFVLLFLCIALLSPLQEILFFQDVSGDVRRTLFVSTFSGLLQEPVTGAGLAAFPEFYDRYREPAHQELLEYAHNSVLDFWAQLGLAGLLWYLATYIGIGIFLIHSLQRKIYKNAHLIGTFLCVYGIYGLVDVPYFKNDLSILFWFFLALLINKNKKEK